jgi:hypothetical protein
MTRVLTEWLGAMVDYFSGLWICDGLRVGVRLLVQRHQPLGPDAKTPMEAGFRPKPGKPFRFRLAVCDASHSSSERKRSRDLFLE